jgi:Tfp pilus assembly protein PilV
MKTYRITQRSTVAFSLVEVTIALGVAGFCLIAILGLLPAGLNTNQNSVRQTTANGILSSIVADLRATTTGTQSNLFQIPFSGTGTTQRLCCDGNGACALTSSGGSGGGDNDSQGGGSGSGSQCANAIFSVKVTFPNSGGGDNDQGGGSSLSITTADVTVTWPYSAAGGGGSDNDSGIGGDNDSQGGGSSSTLAGIVETFVTLAPGVSAGQGEGD